MMGRSRSTLLLLAGALLLMGAWPLATTTARRADAEPDMLARCGDMPAATGVAATMNGTPIADADLLALLETMPLEVKIGQMLMAGVMGTEVGDDAQELIAEYHVGNVIIMGRNVDSPEQVLALTTGLQDLAIATNGGGLIIGTDQEGGLVQRLNSASGFLPMPDAATVGAADCPELVRAYARAVGEELRAVGVTLAFAPVLDVNDNPDNPVIGGLGRSFGVTPERVERSAIPFIAGLHDANVMAVGKHFPGHGSTTTDSHLDLPYVEKDRAELDAVELAPFQAAVDIGVDAIMPAHVSYPALDSSEDPATVSAPIQTDVLRGEMGFDGLIITDDMGMTGITSRLAPGESAVRAVEAGTDIVLCVRMTITGACPPEMFPELHAGLMAAVESGRLNEERIDQSVTRILAAKATYGTAPTPNGLQVIRSGAHFQALADLYAAVAARLEE